MNKYDLTMKVWDNQLNPKTKKHLYLEDFCIENQVDEEIQFCKEIWEISKTIH